MHDSLQRDSDVAKLSNFVTASAVSSRQLSVSVAIGASLSGSCQFLAQRGRDLGAEHFDGLHELRVRK